MPLLQFHDDHVGGAGTDVGAAVLDGAIGPEDVAAGAVHGCQLAVGGLDACGEIGEQDDGATGARMLVPLFAVAGISGGAEDAHLRVLEEELVVSGIDRQGVEIAGAFGRNGRGGLFDFDFDDAEGGVADDLADVHTAGGAPGDVAGLPMEVLGGGAGVGDILIGGVEVDHDATELVLVERGGLVRTIECGEDADARIVDGHGGLGGEPEREQGEEKGSHGYPFGDSWDRRFVNVADGGIGESISESAGGDR
jgi:hypothetical protein